MDKTFFFAIKRVFLIKFGSKVLV